MCSSRRLAIGGRPVVARMSAEGWNVDSQTSRLQSSFTGLGSQLFQSKGMQEVKPLGFNS